MRGKFSSSIMVTILLVFAGGANALAHQLRIRVNPEQKAVTVTDEAGNRVPASDSEPESLTNGGDCKIIFTTSSPTCGWFFWNGNWHRICG